MFTVPEGLRRRVEGYAPRPYTVAEELYRQAEAERQALRRQCEVQRPYTVGEELRRQQVAQRYEYQRLSLIAPRPYSPLDEARRAYQRQQEQLRQQAEQLRAEARAAELEERQAFMQRQARNDLCPLLETLLRESVSFPSPSRERTP